MFTGRRDHLISARRRIPFTLSKLRKAKSVKFIGVGIDSLISISYTGWDGDKCACGNSHAVGKCEWAQRETGHGNWEEVETKSASRSWSTGEIIQRTEAEAIKSLGLSEKTVHLVHLVHSGLRPTFFSNRRVNLLAEGFDIFWIRK